DFGEQDWPVKVRARRPDGFRSDVAHRDALSCGIIPHVVASAKLFRRCNDADPGGVCPWPRAARLPGLTMVTGPAPSPAVPLLSATPRLAYGESAACGRPGTRESFRPRPGLPQCGGPP